MCVCASVFLCSSLSWRGAEDSGALYPRQFLIGIVTVADSWLHKEHKHTHTSTHVYSYYFSLLITLNELGI